MHLTNLFGYEIYNNTKCAIGQFNINNLIVRIWIDINNGTCLKTINMGVDSSGKKYEVATEYIVTYNVVTDDNIKKPDLAGYTLK